MIWSGPSPCAWWQSATASQTSRSRSPTGSSEFRCPHEDTGRKSLQVEVLKATPAALRVVALADYGAVR
jgi:hypothetical protein